MDAPPVQYVRTSDGYDIAYGISGSGRLLVRLPVVWNHFSLQWNPALLGPEFEAFASRFIERAGHRPFFDCKILTVGHYASCYRLAEFDSLNEALWTWAALAIRNKTWRPAHRRKLQEERPAMNPCR